ncbi:MAG: hypothetical protein NC548_13015 [Lachnospiraceae bacterium]|nr:hypothetical protein [Lachnospiraceae bacterium]MCM1230689.1 hypothetical protein [Ruminococcus flavefaciens]
MNQKLLEIRRPNNIFQKPTEDKQFIISQVHQRDLRKNGPRNTKFRVASRGPWLYLKHKSQSPSLDARNMTIDNLTKFAVEMYLKKIVTIYTAKLDIDQRPDVKETICSILRESKRIFKYTGTDEYSFKMVNSSISMYCTISKLSGNSGDLNQSDMGIIVMIHDNDQMITTGHMVFCNSTTNSMVDVSGPAVMSTNRKTADAMLKSYLLGMPPESDGMFSMSVQNINLIYHGLKTLRKQLNNPDLLDSSRANHTPMEMFTIISAKKSIDNDDALCVPSIREYSFKQSFTSSEILRKISNGFPSSGKHTDSNPLIDLSAKEFKYIFNYVKRHNYLRSPDCDGTRINVNMTKLISASRYGSSFIYPVSIGGQDIKSQLLFNIGESDDEGNLMMDISMGNISFIVTAVFDDMTNFNLYDNVVTINITAIIDDMSMAPTSADEMDKYIPEELSDLEPLYTMIYEICAMFIVIGERPERTRIVRETIRKPCDPAEKKDHEELDYVIRRILKTKADAKSYVEKMGSEYKDREYTMESWPRAGHTRQLKSGKIIYIRECECHRRLPLSDKEIHLKL